MKTSKILSKRVLAFILIMMMIFSILPAMVLPVLAEEHTSAEQIEKNGGTQYYKKDGTDATSRSDAWVGISKTIEGTDVENEFEITLTVETKQESSTVNENLDASAVLVLDMSGSMWFCATCGSGNNGSLGTHSNVNNSTTNPCYSRRGQAITEAQTRYYALREAAKTFVDTFAQDEDEAYLTDGTSRYISIVVFGSSGVAQTIGGNYWVDVATEAGRTAVTSYLNGLTAFTNTSNTATNGYYTAIECGLAVARNLYIRSNVTNTNNRILPKATITNNNVVLFTDGVPNRGGNSGTGTTGLSISSNGGHSLSNTQLRASEIKSGSTGTTPRHAAALYAIAYAEANIQTLQNIVNGSNGNSSNNSSHVYSATTANLSDIFETLSKEITSSAGTGGLVVTDPMGDHIVWSVIEDQSQTGITGDLDGFTWMPTDDGTGPDANGWYTYTYKYKITLNNLDDAYEGGPTDTNGKTSLAFSIVENGQTTGSFTKDFNVPQVAGFEADPTLSFKKVGHDNANIGLEGIKFTLESTDIGDDGKPLWEDTAESLADGTVTFGAIPSGHTYILKEDFIPAALAGIYDSNEQEYTVVVSWGEIDGENSDIPANGTFNFVNPTKPIIEIKKVWLDVDGTTVLANDVATYEGTTATFTNGTTNWAYGNNIVEKGGTYTIAENNIGDDWVLDSVTGTTGVTINDKSATITNAAVNTTYTVTFKNKLNKVDFPFTKTWVNGNVKNSINVEITGSGNFLIRGTISPTADPKTIGGFDYSVEVTGDTWAVTIEGLNPNDGPFTVAETGVNGTALVENKAVGYAMTQTGDTITNTYSATGEVVLEANKTANVDIEAGQFEFAVYAGTDTTAAPLKTANNAADGKVTFGAITYSLTDVAGSPYTYTIKETSTNGGGWGVDTTDYRVVVSLVDNGNGTITATPAYSTTNGNPPTFNNTYSATGRIILNATKTATGKAMTEGQFNFAVYAGTTATGTPVATGSNASAGMTSGVTFSAITYNLSHVAGSPYTYTIKETSTNGGGWAVDTNEYRVVVSLVDNGNGTITATPAYQGTTSATTPPEFVNDYTATGEVTIVANKTATGKAMTAGQFEFGLYKENGDLIEKKTNISAGTTSGVTFTTITYNQTDIGETYVYKIKEISTDGDGWKVDETIYTVTVAITDGGNGNLTVIPTYTDGDAEFENVYEADGYAELEAYKTANVGIEAGQFEFGVYEVINGNVAANPIETAFNADDGTVTFEKMYYDESNIGETHTYVIKEIIPADEDKVGGWDYDRNAYGVTVTIADGEIGGTLDITVVYEDDEIPTFENTYSADGSIKLYATKTAEGRALDKTFNFAIYEGTTQVATGTNTAAGAIEFGEITYDLDDVAGSPYTYTIKETSTTGGGWTVDENTIYTIYVKVVDNGNGNLTVTAYSDSACTQELEDDNNVGTFTNTYNASGSIVLNATKTANKELDKAFSFGIFDASGNLFRTATNTVPGGAITFDAIDYTAAGIHAYTIKELTPSDPNWTTDNTSYTVYVNVVDNGNGTLTAKAYSDSECTQELEDDNNVGTFNNTYNTTSVTVRKTWDDADWEGRPDSIKFNLLQNGTKINEYIMTAPWADYTFEGLDIYDDEQEEFYEYTVTEDAVAGYYDANPPVYNEEEDLYEFTNERRPTSVDIVITKMLDIPEEGDYLTQTLPELICPLDVHEHDEDCYDFEEVLVCEHVHSDECYEWDWEDVTELIPVKGDFICPNEDEDHEHDEDTCWEWNDEEMVVDRVLVPSADPVNCTHVCDEDCYENIETLICGYDIEHTHDNSCYDNNNAIVGKDYISKATFKFTVKDDAGNYYDEDGIYGADDPHYISISFNGDELYDEDGWPTKSVTVEIPETAFMQNENDTTIYVEEVWEPYGWEPSSYEAEWHIDEEARVQEVKINKFGDIIGGGTEIDGIVTLVPGTVVFINTYRVDPIPFITITKRTFNARTESETPENAGDKAIDFTFIIEKGDFETSVTIPASWFVSGEASIKIYLPQLRGQSLRGLKVTEDTTNFGDIWRAIGNGEVQYLNRGDERALTFDNEFKDDRYPVITVRKTANIASDETFNIAISGVEGLIEIKPGEDKVIPLTQFMNWTGTLTLREIDDGKKYWDYDARVYTITVDKGVIVSGPIVFTFYNEYNTPPEINIRKIVSTRAGSTSSAPSGITFNFELYERTFEDEKEVLTLVNEDDLYSILTSGNGTYDHETIVLNGYRKQTATLILKESIPNSTGDWTYDSRVYTIEIVRGEIVSFTWVNESSGTQGLANNGDTAIFENSYYYYYQQTTETTTPATTTTETVTTTEEITTTTVEIITTTEPTIETTAEETVEETTAEEITDATVPQVVATFPDEPDETTVPPAEPTIDEEVLVDEVKMPLVVAEITEAPTEEVRPNPQTGNSIVPILLMMVLMGAGAGVFMYTKKRLSITK
ncbi:MAG: Cna B-type domain-containing protein [Oscillospiraceae bacterium]|nr:Cna B-type domain-containing protein [Oscillospiraceae bacterium]